jgi:two-component system, chemotaxis family, chemotaxis protein CheY
MIAWCESMSVGMAEIDRDHQVLFDIVNQFEDCSDFSAGEVVIKKLYHYAQGHFHKEEQIQLRCGYPKTEWHKGEHERILNELQSIIRTRFRPGTPHEWQRAAMAELSPQLREYILDHVITIDAQMIPYLHSGRAATQVEAASTDTPYSRLRVMVIDDSAFCRKAMSKALQSIGVRSIIEATDGSDGIVIYQKKQPHLILCDLEMFPVDGFVFVKALRAEESKSNKATPVIFMTSHTEPSNIAQAKQLGVAGYLVKPVPANELKKRVDAIFFQQRAAE